MKEKKIRLTKCIYLMLLSVIFIFGTTNTVSAAPFMSDFTVSSSKPVILGSPGIAGYTNVYSEYEAQAALLGEGFFDVFCIEDVLYRSDAKYHLWGLDEYINSLDNDEKKNNHKSAAKIASNYYYNPGWTYSQQLTQLAIWNVLFGVAATNNSLMEEVTGIVESLGDYEYMGGIAVAVGTNPNSQNFMVSVPEPATMFLLGIGLIGLLLCTRKKILNP